MGTLDDYKNKLEAHKRAGQELQKQGQKIFEAAAKELFEKYPSLDSFGWEQYTPHFNDGDPCYFSVHGDEDISMNGITYWDLEYDQEAGQTKFDSVEEWKDFEDPEAVLDEIGSLIHAVDQDCLERYGEGRVVVSRDGTVECDYVDHD